MSSDSPGLLGDTPARDYARKLRLFNAFAEPELRAAIAALNITPGMRVLDAGCGTGEALAWLAEAVGPQGLVCGMDLSGVHVAAARERAQPGSLLVQSDLQKSPWKNGSFDLIWCINTVNHLREPVEAVRNISALLLPGGMMVLGQGSFLPEMFFAWDMRLERLTNEAVRRYYRDRYGLDERAMTEIRGLVGILQRAGLRDIKVRTVVIERLAPLRPTDEEYLLEAIFRGTWGERLKPYLSSDDFETLQRLCNPARDEFALRRKDFHHIQTLTFVSGIS